MAGVVAEVVLLLEGPVGAEEAGAVGQQCGRGAAGAESGGGTGEAERQGSVARGAGGVGEKETLGTGEAEG